MPEEEIQEIRQKKEAHKKVDKELAPGVLLVNSMKFLERANTAC